MVYIPTSKLEAAFAASRVKKRSQKSPSAILFPSEREAGQGVCANSHVGKHGDVCTAIGCNGTPFR